MIDVAWSMMVLLVVLGVFLVVIVVGDGREGRGRGRGANEVDGATLPSGAWLRYNGPSHRSTSDHGS